MAGERVLLVDDETEFVEALSERLSLRDMRVTAASNGEEALEQCRKQRFDAIILDLAMPGMDGIETLRAMRELNDEVQVILLTGRGTVKKSIEAMKLGAMDFLEKPVDMEVLLSRIKEAQNIGHELETKKSEAIIAEILRTKGW